MERHDDDLLLTTEEAAKVLKLSAGTLRNWRSEGKGPSYVKVGGLIRYRIQDLEHWILTQTVVGGEEE